MSKYDVPTPARLKRGVLVNKAAQAAIARPLLGCEDLCTEAAILEGRPCIMVYQYGYISTSGYDAEECGTSVPQLGELLEIRPLEPDDEFHPEKVLVVVEARKFPLTRRATDPHKQPRPVKPKTPKPPVAESPDEDNDDLARELGLL